MRCRTCFALVQKAELPEGDGNVFINSEQCVLNKGNQFSFLINTFSQCFQKGFVNW